MKKKILFIDSWTKGIHNFIPVANMLKQLNWESLLVHRGSWGYKVETIENFLEKCLEKRKPECCSYFNNKLYK